MSGRRDSNSGSGKTTPGARVLELATTRAITEDDIAEVHNLHITAFTKLGGALHDAEHTEAFAAHVNTPAYTDQLMQADVWGVWLDKSLLATGGWTPGDDQGKSARIAFVFVNPVFSRLGIGRTAVEGAERRAAAAGFHSYSVRATLNTVPIFERLGYAVTSRGVTPLLGGIDMPVVFMRKEGTGARR
ncbi:MAG: GNAT family N-acetyltransferase [Rhizobiales bacterium]|nr:GNAT family N-acetyltransferase [Hyphomicrobiales bacterium]